MDEFNGFFSKYVSVSEDTEGSECEILPDQLADGAGEFIFQKIEEEDVLRLLCSLDTTKAVGLDGISAKLLKMSGPGVSSSLTSLFNFCIESGQMPDEWKHAKVTPVPKVSNPEGAENYRPISVLPVVVKVFEKIVHHQVSVYLQEHSLLHEAQSGFRQCHTTQDVLLSTVDDWRKEIDNDQLVGSVMIDLSKAFDVVDHSILLRKLVSYGIRGSALKWFTNYFDGRRQRVVIGSARSEWSIIKRGVPQGSILGPLLFTLYVNDLPHAVKECTVKQYADDTTLYSSSDSPAGLEHKLSSDLDEVNKWVDKNKLRINEKKTQMLLMSRRRRANELDEVNIVLDGRAVSRSESVKYLGVMVDDKLKWKEQIAAVRRKSFAGLAKIRRLRDVLPVSTKIKLYNALVLPHVDYCSVVWQECGKVLQQKVERIQNYGMRLILSRPPRTPSKELRQSLKWMSLTQRRQMFRLSMVHRCINHKAPRYLQDQFTVNGSLPGYPNSRGQSKLHLGAVRSEVGRSSFGFKGAQEWNQLPVQMTRVQPASRFKNLLRTHLINQ